MATHDAWVLICRLFAGGTPVLRATLSPREASALAVLGKAVKPTVVDGVVSEFGKNRTLSERLATRDAIVKHFVIYGILLKLA